MMSDECRMINGERAGSGLVNAFSPNTPAASKARNQRGGHLGSMFYWQAGSGGATNARSLRVIVFFLLLLEAVVPGARVLADDSRSVGGEYRADIPYPEFMPLWREGWSWTDENGEKVRYARPDMPLGGYVFAIFRNSTGEPIEVEDVLLDDVSLAQAVAPEHKPRNHPDDKYPSSLRFSKLAREQIDKLEAAGEPVWWKIEPMVVPPGRYGQVTVRLRRDPKVETLTVSVPGLPETDGRVYVSVKTKHPRFFSINFTPEYDVAYAYLRHPSGKGIAPRQILLDGQDVTGRCTITADDAVDTVPVIIKPTSAFKRGDWYLFQAVYADGSTARVGIGAWQPGLVYGMWGYSKVGKTEDENRKFFLEDMRVHNINTLMYSIPGEVRKFLRSPEGQEYSKKTGIRIMTNWVGDAVNPPFMFLTDEPDAGDFASKMLDPYKRIGSLAQWLVNRANMFRREEPKTPVLLNVDNTFKPENWYTYAQLADLPCADPYYQEGVQSMLKSDPTNWGPYLKPTYVYAVGTVYQSAGAPKPMHLILHTCRFDMEDCPYRGPTPQEKRIEVYYSLAAGAKALSFWWYTPFGEYYGCGGSDKDMRALWKEIGLVGAEIRSAESTIIRSCPAAVPVSGPRMLWIRSLLVGDDALGLIVVNDNFASDRLGTIYRPVQKAKVRIRLPSWLKPADVFEITSKGTRNVEWQVDAEQLTLDLDTVDLTRFVLIGRSAGLREQTQQVYQQCFAANVKRLLSEQAAQ
ncbi:MAG: hypothetical protein ACUVXJ_16680 [Phycisphaerae bacterium]